MDLPAVTKVSAAQKIIVQHLEICFSVFTGDFRILSLTDNVVTQLMVIKTF
jgi:hypothetical protein